MNLKTPKFNKVLEEYFSKLKLDKQEGQERICRISGEKFYISAEDVVFYKKIGVPLPTLSPEESMRKKLAYANIYNLFFVTSARTGKKIVAAYPPDTSFKIWEHQIWNSDKFSPLKYGIFYNSKKSFFRQFAEFQLSVPRANLININSVNCDYGNGMINSKDCYLTSDSKESEDCNYSNYPAYSKQVYHSYAVINSEIIYDSTLCFDCYKLFFSEHSNNCLDSYFLFDCRNCTSCFMCTNLRHKKYCFYNQQLSKEEYMAKMKEINLGSRKKVEKLKKDFQEIKRGAIHRANHNEKNINCSGDYVTNSKNSTSCFWLDNSENCKFVAGGTNHYDLRDVVGGQNISQCYNTMTWWANDVRDGKFSFITSYSQNLEYCEFCQNCQNCFACIGLKNKKFCIFNKQYTEEEYCQKIDEIKTKMLVDGEYGEFFPRKMMTVSYNIALASSYGGYDGLGIAKKYGYKIKEAKVSDANTNKEVNISETPDDVKNVRDDSLSRIFVSKTGRKFRYIKKELEFHRRYNIALPTEHHSVTLSRKRIALGPIDFNLKYRKCTKCGEKTQVTFPEDYPDAPEKIYCEKCYNRVIG